MNPSNPFGSPQGGAFQAPSNNMKTGLFQSFGQQNTTNQPQTMGFFQPPAFGQAPPHGGTVFGQAPAFGQSSTQSSSLPAASQQAPAFGGQPSLGMSSSGFGSGSGPAFGQTSNPNQSSVFGNPPAFGQPSAFGQTPGFGKPPPAYGQQPSGFGNPQMSSSGSTAGLGQPQVLGFGPSLFGQPPPGPVITTTSMFGASQSVTQSRGFGSSKFNFKPANEALFKPIFSASPEPANPQTTSMSGSPFGGSPAQTSASSSSSSTTTGFPLLTGAKSGSLGFSFSQPAAAPSIPAPNNPLTAGNSSGGSSTLQFTFSQPAAPSSSSPQTSSTQPTTPSSFSFSVKAPLPETTTPLFSGTSFVQPSAFGDNKAKAESSVEEKGSNLESLEETNVFARLSKGTKRKEEPLVPSAGAEKPATEGDASADADAPSHPSKRPLVRLRGLPGGLFGRALGDLRRGGPNAARREAAKDARPQPSTWTETEGEDVPAQTEDPPPPLPAIAQTLSRETAEESGSASDLTPETKTPVKQVVRRESSESLSGAPPPDCTVLHCKNIPPALNKMDVIQKHFSQFGKVRKVTCRHAKNTAIVHFDDHASALRAKRKGRMMHKQELLLLWQRKKQSPGDKARRPTTETEETEGQSEIQEATKPPTVSSPLKRPAVRAPPAFAISSPLKKPPLVKTQHFDTEPQKESSAEAPVSERSVPSSLLPLVDQVAESAEDKYRLLEQRDKILRQGRPKRLDMSKVFVGTCPDMCPEKERYMRETRKQLSMFEVISETEMVNHTAAIKEYSRSSADQEEPLPHELRPLPVLSMTMDYLVTQIMDQGHENYRDWYDFVWNRTRGIRKDITQQRLCCPRTVALIEKCTRFHVHCAHHLCEEHISAFDAKINNENMTKCLQSLKEMYQDLATNQTFCAQEAEFRQYSVLLKLNDGDILREVQQFRDEVRNSPEVKFAVQAFAAVNNNNFVRFFKLVKGASYLASCLLHRYFNQVRSMALKTLNWAHTVGPRSIPFPLDDIVRMLMFRNAAEAADFIQQYGLVVTDDVVELSRSIYQEPDLPQSQKKSDIILAKKTMLVGEVVNGGPLPDPPQHTPVCSFDSHNKYRGEVPVAEPPPAFRVAVKTELKVPPTIEPLMQVKVQDPASMFAVPPAATDETGEPQLFQPIAPPQPVKPPSPPPKPQPAYSAEDVAAVLDAVIEEVVEAAVREVADAGASYATAALAESSVQAGSLVDEVLGLMLQEMSSTEIQLERERVAEEKRKLEEARRRREHELFLQQFSLSLCTELVHEVLDETIKETTASEIQLAVNEKADRVAKCTEQVCSSLVQETVNADVALLVAEVLEAELQRIHKYIKRWRDVVAVRRQLKRQMRGFPAAPCCVDPRFKLRALAPSAPPQPSMADLARGLVNLGNAGTLALSSTRLLKVRQEVIHQMRVHYFYQRLLDESAWAPLDLPALVTEHTVDPPDRIFWKAVLLLPSDHETGASLADRILSDWLEVKLGGSKDSDLDSDSDWSRQQQVDGTLQTLCVSNTVREKEKRLHRVHLSVKASRGPLTEDGLSKMEECCELQGARALISLLPALPVLDPERDEQDVPLLSALLQLRQLQQASSWHSPLPLVVLVPGPDGDTHKLEQALMLHTLVSDGLISDYTFLFIPETTSDLQGSRQLVQAVQWLLARAPPPFPLSCRSLVHLVEAALSREFTPRVSAHRQERAAADLPSEEPAPVIRLYNSVLAHVADAVSNQDLGKLSWPPGEFCQPETRDFVPHRGWNSAEHLAWLQDSVLSLQLPPWEQLSDADSWSELCSSIFGYAAQISLSRRSQPLLMSRLENLLQKVRHQSRRAPRSRLSLSSWSQAVEEDVSPAFSRIPWDDVLMICIDHKLKDWQVPSAPVCEDAVTEHGEILVYFPTESLNGFQPPEDWTRAVARTHRQKQEEREGSEAAACAAPSTPALRQRLFPSLLEPQEAPTAPLDITHTPTPQELLVHKVLQGLEEEKAESRRSTEQIQRWLDGDAVDHLSTPLFIPSSTLLSMPTTVRRTPPAKTRDAAVAQEPEAAEDPSEKNRPRAASMAWRLKELQRQIVASQEEELACRLELSGLLSIVED